MATGDIRPRSVRLLADRSCTGSSALAAEDVGFVIARLKAARRQQLRAVGLIGLVGENRVYPTVRAAVEAVSRSPTRGATDDG